MKHRILAVLLVLCLCFSLVPVSYAEGETFENSVDVEQLIAHAVQMYSTLEGHYDSVTRVDSNALSIGFLQWHGNNAKYLLQMICCSDPMLSENLLGTSLFEEVMNPNVNWKSRCLSVAEGNAVKALIDTEVGHQCQDAYAHDFIYDEAKVGWRRGIRSEAALLYYCSIENQFGIGGANTCLGYLRETMALDMGFTDTSIIDSLELFHTVWLTAAASGRYPNSIGRYKYARVKVYNFIVNNLGMDPESDPNTTPFTDLPASGHWARQAIKWAYNHDPQITAGTSATTFSPNATLTRGEAMTFLWAAAGKPEPSSSNNPFADVSSDKYYYSAVLWAVEKGITAGKTADSFAPNDSVSRAEMLTFLWAFAGKQSASGSSPFLDVTSDRYYYTPVLWAYANGILVGNESGSSLLLDPKADCSRAYVVTYLYRYFT